MTAFVAKVLRTRKMEIPEITPAILGELLVYFMLAVTCVFQMRNINPFDQPAVERGKFFDKKCVECKSILTKFDTMQVVPNEFVMIESSQFSQNAGTLRLNFVWIVGDRNYGVASDTLVSLQITK
jgi:hypothetical protein